MAPFPFKGEGKGERVKTAGFDPLRLPLKRGRGSLRLKKIVYFPIATLDSLITFSSLQKLTPLPFKALPAEALA
jgi:hypothetical protein